MEVKVGPLNRADIGQLGEYCHYFHDLTGTKPRGMLIGTSVAKEVGGAITYVGLEWKAITQNELVSKLTSCGDKEMLALLDGSGGRSLQIEIFHRIPVVAPKAVVSQASVPPKQAEIDVGTDEGAVDDKLRAVFDQKDVNREFATNQIVARVEDAFPGAVKKGGVLPSDRCYNITNAGLASTRSFRIFVQVKQGLYRYLGEHYPYNGPVKWKGESCGLWTDGVLTKWDNWPVLRSEGTKR